MTDFEIIIKITMSEIKTELELQSLKKIKTEIELQSQK